LLKILISYLFVAEGRGKDGREACDDFSGTDLVFKRSVDGGTTWSSLGIIWSNSSSEEPNVVGNAAPVQDTNGRIWMPFCRNNEEVFITFSDDDGLTWSSPEYHPELVLEDWKWVGLGPPGGLLLSTGRMVIPSYHTVKWKGDGCASRGHTLISDDNGVTWQIGSSEFGAPYLSNECQAVELGNGTLLINARTVSTHRIQVMSHDGGLTFEDPYQVNGLVEPIEGCEGSLIRYPGDQKTPSVLLYSGPNNNGLFRRNMTVMKSFDGLTWETHRIVDRGAVSYSSLQIIPPLLSVTSGETDEIGLLYERSNVMQIVFEPDEILFVRYPLPTAGAGDARGTL
jgi:sialidase-1